MRVLLDDASPMPGIAGRKEKGAPFFHGIELYCRTQSSEWKWILTKGRIIARDKAGRPLVMSGTHADIADRRQIEEALRRSEERFRIALSNSQVTVFEHDRELRYTFNHRPFFGHAPEKVIGRRDRDMLSPESADGLEALKQSVIDTEQPVRKEVNVAMPDGRTQYFDFYAEPKRDESGRTVGILGTAVDITARKQAEECQLRLKNIYVALSEVNNAIIHEREEKTLLDLVCRLAVERAGMYYAWIGVPDEEGMLDLVARFGAFSHRTRPVAVSTRADVREGQGPGGVAFRENRPVIVNDVLGDERILPWREQMMRDKVGALAIYPIRRGGRSHAVLVIVSDQLGAFGEDISSLLEGMAGNIGFALDNFDREAERKKAEKELRESESRFRHLADAMPQLVWTANADGQVDYHNRWSEDYSGFRHTEAGMIEWLPVIHPDDAEAAARAWKHAVEMGENYQLECRLRRADGSCRWHINRAIPARNKKGRIVKWYGTSADIHDQKSAQQAAQRAEELLRLAQQAARIGTFDWNIRNNIIESALENEPLYGLPPGAFKGSTFEQWRDLVHPEDCGMVEQMVRESMQTGFLKGEWRVVWPDGTVRWLAARAQVFRDESGKPLRMVGINMDITEHKEAEEAMLRLSEQRQIALDAARLGWWHFDPVRKVVTYDRLYAEIFEIDGVEPHGENTFYLRVHPDDLPDVRSGVEAALNAAAPQPYDAQFRIVLADGSVRWVQRHGITTFAGKGKRRRAILFAGTVADITETRRAEEEVRLAATVYRDSSEAMMVTDEHNDIVAVNQAFSDMTGYAADEVLGQNPRIFKSGHHDAAYYGRMWEQLRATGRFKGEVWNKKKDDSVFAARLTINAIEEEGKPRRYVALMSDITDKKRSDELIWFQANFDALTKLPNRRFFRDRLEHEVKIARRSSLRLALMFLDLDGFKDVNDTLGHDMGDLLLKEAAERLKASVRESDTVARLGGDEFTLILTELHDARKVDKVARHILQTLSEPIRLGEELAYVSASIGITLFPNDAAEVEELIKNADQAMYSAKQAGKNRYHFFTPEMQDVALRRMRIINDMRGALEASQFEIAYQPIVELSSGVIRKAEALIRWRHPAQGLINPIDFISAAEDTGMISSFGNWIFHEAARQAAFWRERHHPQFQVSVNISPVQFRNEGIDPCIWFEHLKRLGLPGKGIVVEITEGLLLEASPKVKDQLLMLRDAGIEVSLDDFGTGYSSLSYLQKFDIDYLKIDRAFIRNLAPASGSMALCEAIIVMAHKLGLEVIAEGVETEEQRDLLVQSGCDYAQGYLFSKPLPAEEFEVLVRPGSVSRQNYRLPGNAPH